MMIAHAANVLTEACGKVARDSGWNNDPDTGKPRTPQQDSDLFPVRLMLIVSELAEAMEGHRKGLRDDKLPHRQMMEVEVADAAIRIFHLAELMGFDLGNTIAEKLAFNAVRSDHKPENRAQPGGKAY